MHYNNNKIPIIIVAVAVNKIKMLPFPDDCYYLFV